MSQQINLCNPLFRKQEKYFSAVTMAQSLGLIVVATLLFYGYSIYQTRALTRQAAQMSQMQDTTQRQFASIAATLGPRKPDIHLTEAIKLAESEVKNRQDILDILSQGELGNQAGFSEYLKALSRQTVNGLWLTGFDVTGSGDEISIRGRAMQAALVPGLIRKLKVEPKFAGTHFATLDIHQPTAPRSSTATTPPPYVEFTLGKVQPVEQTQ